MKLLKLFSRREDPPPPLRKHGEDTKPDPRNRIKVARHGGDPDDSGNGSNVAAATRYGPG